MTFVGRRYLKYKLDWNGRQRWRLPFTGLDEVQSYQDILQTWTAISESETGKRPPLSAETKAKIVKGLVRTMNESCRIKTRSLAARALLAIDRKMWGASLRDARPARKRANRRPVDRSRVSAEEGAGGDDSRDGQQRRTDLPSSGSDGRKDGGSGPLD